jgi:large subunit ribosomal protein L25
MITLAAENRTETGKKARSLKGLGRMGAVVYGPKHPSTAIVVESRAFEKVLKNAGESSVIEITGLGAPIQALIHEVDRDPVTNVPRHADFYAIEKGAKVEVAVPLVFVGESLAVKEGASLVKVLHELEIEADAANLPHEISVDISTLVAVGDQIHVSDLKIPAGVTLRVDAEEVVALAQQVEVEKEEEVSAAPDMASIEVEKKGKDEEETETAE